jgi:hypothetical protein
MMQIPLVLSALVYFGIAVLVYMFLGKLRDADGFPFPMPIVIVVAGFCILLGLAVVVLAAVVQKKSKAVYITCAVVTALYLPSAHFIFGIPMLVFLLKKEAREYYQIGF